MRCLLLAKHRKGERNAKVDTGGEVLVGMAEKPWYKPVFGTLVVLGLVLIATGAMFTEQGADEIAYGTNGQFVIDASNVDASIIVVSDEVEGNCENFAFSVDLQDGNDDFIPVEKTDCERWSSSESYQYRLNNLTQGRYGFSASDDVSILAVETDLEDFMEDYAFGNAVADIGTSMCCLSMLLNLFIGRSLTKANKEQQVALNHAQVVTSDAQTNFVQTVSTVDTAAPEDTPAPEASVSEQEEAPGSFWGGIKDD